MVAGKSFVCVCAAHETQNNINFFQRSIMKNLKQEIDKKYSFLGPGPHKAGNTDD